MCFPWLPWSAASYLDDDQSRGCRISDREWPLGPDNVGAFRKPPTREDAVESAKKLLKALQSFLERVPLHEECLGDPGLAEIPGAADVVKTATDLIQSCQENHALFQQAEEIPTRMKSLAEILENTRTSELTERNELRKKMIEEANSLTTTWDRVEKTFRQINSQHCRLLAFTKSVLEDGSEAKECAFPSGVAFENLNLLRRLRFSGLQLMSTQHVDAFYDSFKISMEQLAAAKKDANAGSPTHLPPLTDPEFSAPFAKLVFKKVGNRVGDPWKTLSKDEVQAIVDAGYGEGEHKVEDEDVWSILTTHHLKKWRQAFSTAATDTVKEYFVDLDRDRSTDKDKIKQTVAEMLEWEEEDGKSGSFYWDCEEEGGSACQEVPFRSQFVLRTLALAHYHAIDEYPRIWDDKPPFGALILAIQAVEHALRAWESGAFIERYGFSAQFYGEHLTDSESSMGAPSAVQSNKPMTQYTPTMEKFEEVNWHDIFLKVAGFLDLRQLEEHKGTECAPSSDGSVVVVEANRLEEDGEYLDLLASDSNDL